MRQKTDRLMLRNDSSSSSSSHTSFAKSFRPRSTHSARPGGKRARPAAPRSIHKTTLAISPELKECATCPQPVATLSRWEHSKDWETASWNYHCFWRVKSMIIYTGWKIKRVEVNARRRGSGSSNVLLEIWRGKKKKIRCKENISTSTPARRTTNQDDLWVKAKEEEGGA